MRPHEREQLFLAGTTLHSGLGESGGNHAQRARAAPKRRLGGVEDAVARQADHAEIDRVGDVLDRGVGAHAGDRGARTVDRICSTGEAARQNVAEELSADRAALRDAPITATVRGSKNGRSEAVTATWSRSSTRAM